jgi:hypothetical protein
MNFVVGRILAPRVARGFAQAKGGEEGARLLADDVKAVVNKYDIGSIERPQVAKEAIDASIIRASKVRDAAWDAVRKISSAKGSLVGKGVGTWTPSEEDVKFAAKMKMPLDEYRAVMARRTAAASADVDLSKNPLAVDAVKQANQASMEINVLKQLKGVADKVAAASKLKPTMLERVGKGAGQIAKIAIPAAIGAKVYHEAKDIFE